MKSLVTVFMGTSFTVGIIYGSVKANFAPDLTCFSTKVLSDSGLKSTFAGAGIMVVCLLLMFASYYSICRTTLRHRREVLPWLQNANHLNKMDIGTVRVSITLVLSFFVTYLPGVCYFFLQSFSDQVPINPVKFNLTISVMYLGSAVNPFIYALMSKSFKKHLFRKPNKNLITITSSQSNAQNKVKSENFSRQAQSRDIATICETVH
ncbi:uncharacterized protein [Ptychodera flava]|uniref:uncharacterized protein n=1 Tax=Ptychodera flava TaxID=63121 RepID=UPI00396A970C